MDNATNLTTGTLPDARLSSNVPLINGTNAFTGTNTFGGVNVTDFARLSVANEFKGFITISSATPSLFIEETDAGANEKLWKIAPGAAQLEIATRTDADGVGENIILVNRTGTTVDTVNFPNGELQYGGVEVGFRLTPQNAQSGDYTLVLTDRGKHIYKASGGGSETITIPANSSVAFPVGTSVAFINQGGGDLTIAITTDTLTWAGVGTTGSRTLADNGIAVAIKVNTTQWMIAGTGLS